MSTLISLKEEKERQTKLWHKVIFCQDLTGAIYQYLSVRDICIICSLLSTYHTRYLATRDGISIIKNKIKPEFGEDCFENFNFILRKCDCKNISPSHFCPNGINNLHCFLAFVRIEFEYLHQNISKKNGIKYCEYVKISDNENIPHKKRYDFSVLFANRNYKLFILILIQVMCFIYIFLVLFYFDQL